LTVSGVSYSTIAHSTEDIAKVGRAILALLPETLRRARQPSIAEATGHHGNPIRILSLDVRGKVEPTEAFEYLLRLLPMADRLMIRDQIMAYWDGRSTVFLRLDKQSCYAGQPRLSNSDDVIRVKISLLAGKHDAASVLDAFELI
jgi:RNA binding exosome subunit